MNCAPGQTKPRVLMICSLCLRTLLIWRGLSLSGPACWLLLTGASLFLLATLLVLAVYICRLQGHSITTLIFWLL